MENSSGGIGFLGLLTIVFIILKLCKIISWSWLWVLAPIWLPIAILTIIYLIIELLWANVQIDVNLKKKQGNK